MINKIKNIKPKVLKLLQDYPFLRDSDMHLLSSVWTRQIEGSILDISTIHFLEMLRNGKLSNPETIRRCRQKIQEQRPELRGTSYKARNQKALETKQQIKTI